MIMKIILYVILWFLAATICAGIIIHLDPDEWGKDFTILTFLLSLTGWWLFLIILFGYGILKCLSKPSLFVAGFLDAFFKKD